MGPYKRFINPRYVKMFNHFLKNVCEPKIFKKYNREVKLKLYGIGITPKSSVYEAIPKEELLDSQATVSFFIDSEPSSFRGLSYVEELIWFDGKTFLQLQNGDWMGYDSEKFRFKIHLNNRPLFPLDYVNEEQVIESKLPFNQKEKNGIKTRLFKENVNNNELKWHFDDEDRIVKIVKSNGWQLQFDNKLPENLKEGQEIFIPKGVYHRVIKGKGDFVVKIKEIKNINENKNSLILERNKGDLRKIIRDVVKDIVNIFKTNDEGEFYLPEYFDEDNMTYESPNLSTPFSVELTIEENDSIENFRVNAAQADDDDTIIIIIHYNPSKKTNLIYDLIGELNEIVAHELRHIVQTEKESFDFGNSEIEDPYEYYTQPHEIDAQYFGFKRLSKLTKIPFDVVVKRWFQTHKDIHKLNDEQIKDIVSKILNYR